jgi:hypothetical protein
VGAEKFDYSHCKIDSSHNLTHCIAVDIILSQMEEMAAHARQLV